MKHYSSDILIIGSGIAGLYCALQAATYANVIIITKKNIATSNSQYAQGGIAAVLDPLDNFERHIQDTLTAGGGINHLPAVKALVKEAPQHIEQLIKLGVAFNKKQGKFDLHREGGHSRRRIAHVNDSTGREVEQALIKSVKQHPRIQVYESHYAIELLANTQGALALNRKTNSLETFTAQYNVLATGGCGQVYAYTTNPAIATGDGFAIAQRAGAKLHDMEFMQFHPTSLNLKNKPHFLLTEALRGEGARLFNSAHQRFMKKYNAQGELASRDVVSQAVYKELQSGPVYLDITHKSDTFIKKHFPYIYTELLKYNLHLDQQPIPITPTAHYMCGGVHTNLHGETSIPNLYAIGEVAHTGVHGANRLASNSILECLVFASRAALHMQGKIKNPRSIPRKKIITKLNYKINTKIQSPRLKTLKKSIQNLAWTYAGITRTHSGLKTGLTELASVHKELLDIRSAQGISVELLETLHICETAQTIMLAASKRKISLGCHYISKKQ